MDKKQMEAAMGSITTRPKAVTKGAITGPKEEKKVKKERKVISITGEDYRSLKMFAAEHGITITEAFARIMDYFKEGTRIPEL